VQEFTGVAHEDIILQDFGAWDELTEVAYYHGTAVASISSGKSIGVCGQATTIGLVRKSQLKGVEGEYPADAISYAWRIADLVAVAESIASKGRG
jgi:hypothetical protein